MDDTINKKGIALPGLVALIISGAIGAGIFDLPRTLARAATPGVTLLAWLIAGTGIFMLALSLNDLVLKKPQLTGVSDYARAGFGDFAGFISGWGYWLSAWLGNVAFATMLMSSLGYFFSAFRGGNTPIAIFVASLISLALTYLVTRGVEGAAAINTIVTIAKLVPLLAFIIIGFVSFKAGVFTAHFWGNMSVNMHDVATYSSPTAGNIFEQIKGCLMAMVWVFVGIEGASMMSDRAEKKSDAAKATIIGVISLIVIYVVISMLPYGYMSANELLKLKEPSLIYLFESMTGPVGGAFIAIGLSISILGAWLSWTMLPVEATSTMAAQKVLPAWFGKLNKFNSPANSLWFTQVLVWVFLFTLLFTDEAYNFAYSLATAGVIVCYAFVGAYEFKLGLENHSLGETVVGFGALLFEILAITLSGLSYLWLCTIAYALGFFFYIKARRDTGKTIKKSEWMLMTAIVVLAIVAIIYVATGRLTI